MSNNRAVLRRAPARAVFVLLLPVVAIAQAQTPGQTVQSSVRPLAVNESRYTLRAGEPVRVVASAETVEFVRTAKTRRATVRGGGARSGFVVGTNASGDEILLAASLTMPPGSYIVDFSAISETGEERVTTLAVTLNPLQPVPSTATQPPVVLLNGWQFQITNSCPVSVASPYASSVTFGSLEQMLYNAGVPVVYFFDNCVEYPNGSIENLGGVLGEVLNLITYSNGTLVPQVDLVAHSMGGLIARSYLAGLQSSGSSWTLSPPANPRVRKLVEIATPNFGSFLAADGSLPIATSTQSSEMIPGSAFLWNLATWNQWGDDLRGVDALAVIGDAGNFLSGGAPMATDGVVSVTSASLSFAEVPAQTIVLPYCHIGPDSGLAYSVIPCASAYGIAEAPDTISIVVSFLGGTTAWQSIGTPASANSYLAHDAGLYFAYFNAAATFLNDVSGVYFGSILLSKGGDTAKSVYYDEFVQAGSGTFQFQSASAGSLTYGPINAPAGYVTVARSKSSPVIFSVTPLLPNAAGRVLESGTTITINGTGFGSAACITCQVLAYPGPVVLTPLSWSNTAITAALPSTFNGITQIVVQTLTPQEDFINIMAAPPPASLTIQTVPSGLQFSLDGGTLQTAPQTFSLAIGSTHSVTVATPQPGATGTQYVFTSWSDGGAASHSFTVNASGALTASFETQYQLTLSASPVAGGTVTPLIGTFYNSGSVVPITATANSGYSFSSWTGAVANPSATATTVTMSSAQTVTANFNAVITSTVPTVNPGGVVNNAGYTSPVSPGSLIAIFGRNMATATSLSFSFPLPTTWNGTSVTINGTAAPLLYVLPGQIGVQVPPNVSVGAATVIVTVNGATATGIVTITPAAPGLFADSTGRAAAQHGDGSAVTPANPANGGEEIVLYGTGQGPLTVTPSTGSAAGSGSLCVDSATVTMNGANALLDFCGLASGFVGLTQINVAVPAGLSAGDVPVVVTINGVASSPAVLAVSGQ